MGGDDRTRSTIEELISSRAIIAHKDGNYGSNYPRTEEFGSEGVSFLTAKSLRDGFVDIAGAPRLGNERANAFTFGFVQADDVLLSHNATIGRVAVVPRYEERLLVGTSLTYFRLDPQKLLPRYFAVYLAGIDFQNQLAAVMSHSTRNQVPVTAQRKLSVVVPPLLEQRAIAHILGTLDDKIELNRRRNQTLEAMARALFKDWFVDFGPVRAKMEGRDGQDGLVSGQRHGRRTSGPTEPYLPADLWQLFPDRLDDDGKPEGWKVTTLGCVTTEIRRGISPSYLESGGVRVLNQKCIRNREINFGLARRHDPSKRKIEGRVVMAGDILVNSTGVGTLGRTAQLWRIDESIVVDSHVSVVRPNTDIVSICYLGLNLTGREAEIEMLGEGSTGQTELSRVRLGSLPVLVPPRQVLEQFDADARPLLDAIFANTVESTTLAALRDTLLPKLISGELRIADAEKLIESGHL